MIANTWKLSSLLCGRTGTYTQVKEEEKLWDGVSGGGGASGHCYSSYFTREGRSRRREKKKDSARNYQDKEFTGTG